MTAGGSKIPLIGCYSHPSCYVIAIQLTPYYSHPNEEVIPFLIIIDLESPENCTELILKMII
jgi:hypothetical protein